LTSKFISNTYFDFKKVNLILGGVGSTKNVFCYPLFLKEQRNL